MDYSPSKRQKTAKMPIISVANDGDLFIKAGSSNKVIRAQSLLLKAASQFFSTLLGPNFVEGSVSFTEANPLDLPDETTGTVVELCRIIHYQPSTQPKLSLFPSLVLLADKWQCTAAVKSYVSMNLGPYFDKSLDEQSPLQAALKLQDAVCIAYMVDDFRLLWRTSRCLVAGVDLKATEFHTELAKIIPTRLKDHLQELQSLAYWKAVYELYQEEECLIHNWLPNGYNYSLNYSREPCGSRLKTMGTYRFRLMNEGIFDKDASPEPRSTVLSTLWASISAIASKHKVLTPNRENECTCYSCPIDMSDTILEIAAKSKRELGGLCLFCVKDSVSPKVEGGCKHSFSR